MNLLANAGRLVGKAVKVGQKLPGLVAQAGKRGISTARQVQSVVNRVDRATGGLLGQVPVLGAGVALLQKGGALDRGLDAAERGVRGIERVDQAINPAKRQRMARAQMSMQALGAGASDAMDVAPRGGVPPAPPMRLAVDPERLPPPPRARGANQGLLDEIRAGRQLRPVDRSAARAAPRGDMRSALEERFDAMRAYARQPRHPTEPEEPDDSGEWD